MTVMTGEALDIGATIETIPAPMPSMKPRIPAKDARPIASMLYKETLS